MLKQKDGCTNVLVNFIPDETMKIIIEIANMTKKSRSSVIRAILNDQAPKVLKKLNKQGE